jgi:ketosteroid isomerase-like protein
MKIRLLLSLAALVISSVVPIFAQQTNTPDPKLREEFIAFTKKFDDAFLKGDATAAAACYTEDGCYVDPAAGPIYGRKAIEKFYTDLFQKVRHTKHASTLEQYSPHIMGTAGNEIWTTGEWNAIFQVENGAPLQAKGYWLDLHVREGDGWKFLVSTFNFSGPPVPVETK